KRAGAALRLEHRSLPGLNVEGYTRPCVASRLFQYIVYRLDWLSIPGEEIFTFLSCRREIPRSEPGRRGRHAPRLPAPGRLHRPEAPTPIMRLSKPRLSCVPLASM